MTHELHRSHYISHLVAFFIVARAKISVVESFDIGCPVRLRRDVPPGLASVCVVCFGVFEISHPFGKGCVKRGDERKIGANRGGLTFLSASPKTTRVHGSESILAMILPQVHLRKPCYDFSFL